MTPRLFILQTCDVSVTDNPGLDREVTHQHLVRVSDFLDPNNPRSMMNITIPQFKDALKEKSVKFYLEKDEFYLAKIVKPTPTVNRLRYSFWAEYDQAQEEKRDMVEENIWRGVCSQDQFFTQIKKLKVQAWMLYPVVDYTVAIEEALMFGLGKVREILEFPLYQTKTTKVGKGDKKEDYMTEKVPDYKVADLMLKAVKMLEDRSKGGVVQKLESKTVQENRNLNVTVHKGNPEPVAPVDEGLMELEIRKLENKFSDKEEAIEVEVVRTDPGTEVEPT